MDRSTCNYDGLDCVCTNCNVAGTPCPADGVGCSFGWCGKDKGRYCAGCVWYPFEQDCPISMRAAKKDIRYVTPDERTEIAHEALALRLATYKYRDPMDDRTHLGIILDDAPRSYGADIDRGRVDLYGYASMALATVQEQQKEIDELRREVHELRAMIQKR